MCTSETEELQFMVIIFIDLEKMSLIHNVSLIFVLAKYFVVFFCLVGMLGLVTSGITYKEIAVDTS